MIMTSEEQQYFITLLKEIRNGENSRFISSKRFTQHGSTSVYRHSVNVAYLSYRFAKRLHLNVDSRALIRGALLHDYFLYDWHVKSQNRPLHGFYHPGRALRNAEMDFELSDVERNIIKTHMFPLTFYLPKHKESVIVCLVDKWISTIETFQGKNRLGK